MKKLFYWLFPSWFHVCEHYEINWKELERDSALTPVIVDPESDNISDALGIDEERADYLMRNAKAAYVRHSKFTTGIEEIAKECKHVNELIWCIFIITGEKKGANGLAQMLFGGPQS